GRDHPAGASGQTGPRGAARRPVVRAVGTHDDQHVRPRPQRGRPRRRTAPHPGTDSHPVNPNPTSLTGERRARDLAALPGEVVDVLVVGLGATGAGVALDAASRGLSVAAIDAHDLAFGTSRWSSKLIHGGLRYLASGQLDVAYESAVERGVLMTHTAPHLV